jgi:hypothetical protein
MRAARTKYSTPKVHPHEAAAAEAIESPDPLDRRRREGPLGAATALRKEVVRHAPDRSPTGVAIGWPVANIRHRFGGYLRAAGIRISATLSSSTAATVRSTAETRNRAAYRHLMA